MVYAYSKPGRCPECGSKKVVNILYASHSAKAGGNTSSKTTACSTEQTQKRPKWKCNSCGISIYMKTNRKCRLRS